MGATSRIVRCALMTLGLVGATACEPMEHFIAVDGPTLTADASNPIVEAEYFACLDGYDEDTSAQLTLVAQVEARDGDATASFQVYDAERSPNDATFGGLYELSPDDAPEQIEHRQWVLSPETGTVCSTSQRVRLRHFGGEAVSVSWSLELAVVQEEGFAQPDDLEIVVRRLASDTGARRRR